MAEEMERLPSTVCSDADRRRQLMAHDTLHGIDYVEVAVSPEEDNQRILNVFFLPKESQDGKDSLASMLAALGGDTSAVEIRGGTRVQGVSVEEVSDKDGHLAIRVSEPGDFSTYTLRIVHNSLDSVFAQCGFNFKAGCPSRFDCRPRVSASSQLAEHPVIDYMAKDYASFRQALLDFAALRMPDWNDHHEADLRMTLTELLAYAADQLSYYQDAVANEAFLETARRRISVRRHARLIDYKIHDGASARVFLQIDASAEGEIPPGTPALTRIASPLAGFTPGAVIDGRLRSEAEAEACAVFETFGRPQPGSAEPLPVPIHPNLNRVRIHTWGDRACCLPIGTTWADLQGDLGVDPADALSQEAWRLRSGDFLLLEEVLGPETGVPSDADPAHRQIVRLTKVELLTDQLTPEAITRVTWDEADALTFPLCVSAAIESSTSLYEPDVSVARGNLVLADHGGRIVGEIHPGPEAPLHEALRRAHRVMLKEGPLSFRVPYPADGVPAARLFDTDPREASPQIVSLTVLDVSDGWGPVDDLLDSDAFDKHFVVETDNDGRALLRFGDDRYGQAPPDGSRLTVGYRVGVGPEGNVGAESIAHLVESSTNTLSEIGLVRNPLPSWGGADLESISLVKAVAPAAMHAETFRAVTEEDYTRAAELHPEVSKAVATFRWTGSWHTVAVTIDPRGRTDFPEDLQERIRSWIGRYALAGYDIEIDPPVFVPLDIGIDVCVDRSHFRTHVEWAVYEALSSEVLAGGRHGFFHPDRFTFGQPLYLSDLCAAVECVDGVDSVKVARMGRFGETARREVEQGLVPVGRLEILRLDNNPSFPENGVLELRMMGGK
ncbi:putative baseplate assembly protein [Candidatus Bipolaricaulota bacterium]